MTVKQKLTKEIDKLPDTALEQLYCYLQYIRNNNKRKPTKKNSEENEWQQFTMQEFLNGYAKSDEIYDKL